MLHKNVVVGERHPVHDWEVADAAALAALVPVEGDVGRIAKQASPLSFHILANHTGPVWHELATTGAIISDHGALSGLEDDDHLQYALDVGLVDRAAFDVDGIVADQAVVWDSVSSTFLPFTLLTMVDVAAEIDATIASDVPPLINTLTINSQTGTTYTFVLTDAGKYVRLDNADAITLTVPDNATVAFPVGTHISIRQGGAGQVTVGGAGVTLNTAETLKLRKIGSSATLIKVATDTWDITGDLELV